MARKMYYTEQEAAETLGVSAEELANYVRDDKLRVFQDGARKMFKSDEVHALAGGGGDMDEEIELSPGALEQAMGEQTSLGGELDLSSSGLEHAMAEQTSLGGILDGAGDQTELAPPVITETSAGEQTRMAPPTLIETTPSGEQTQMAPPTIVEDDDVDLAPGPVDSGLAERVELAPADTSDAVTLVDITDQPVASAKEDTVITAEGISIFDEEDLEIESADPLAKTQIAPSLEDQIAIDGVGSGSGLLDLTRESDDTSLGAEVLDHIDEMESSVGSGMAGAAAVAAEVAPTGREVTYYVRDMPTEVDASSGLFGGLAIGVAVVMVVLTGVVLSVLTNDVPTYLTAMRENVVYVLIGGVFVVGIAGTIGLLVGKSAAEKRMMQR